MYRSVQCVTAGSYLSNTEGEQGQAPHDHCSGDTHVSTSGGLRHASYWDRPPSVRAARSDASLTDWPSRHRTPLSSHTETSRHRTGLSDTRPRPPSDYRALPMPPPTATWRACALWPGQPVHGAAAQRWPDKKITDRQVIKPIVSYLKLIRELSWER